MKERAYVLPLVLVWLLAGLAQHAAAMQDRVGFVDVAREAGVDFRHVDGATPEKYMPETMGSGGLLFDYDNDGWLDIFLVNAGSFADDAIRREARHRLYRNDGDGSFAAVENAGGILPSGYGMGACAADYDNDGWTDLYVTSVGSDRLYRNEEGAGFRDVTAEAGVGTDLWSSSCAFGDLDRDGDLELYVTRYVDFAPDNNRFCGVDGMRDYCHPHVYNRVSDVLYRNEGDGTFTDISRESGIYSTAGKGLGVVLGDYDADGWLDIYVANDSVPNFLFRNRGGGTFEEMGMLAGVAVGLDGRPLAGMGTDMADVDADGRVDVFVTNLNRETHSLYRNLGNGFFSEITYESGVAAATLPYVGFGAAFFDYDNDTDLDLAIANGNVLDHPAGATASRAQLNLLLENDGTGRFTSVGPASGAGFAAEKVSRTLAVGDIDNDGDLDVLVTNNGGEPDLLENRGGNSNNALLVRLVGTRGNRSAVGAALRLRVGNRTLLRHVKAGSSYLGQNDLRAHFGLGARTNAGPLEITWPDGTIETVETIEANRILTITEGSGVTGEMPFRGSPD